MEKKYQPNNFEKKIYQFWEKKGFFTPKIDPKKKPFCIIMPPPNANGALHIGHALFVTIEDLMIRYQRMKGRVTLWLPGADHASIATQVSFERELAKKGKTRFDLGQKKFWQSCFKFTQKNKQRMYQQLRLLGASCDWSRERFTLDKDVTRIVYDTFYQLYRDGLIYRDWRPISWCPRCATTLSDLEVVYQEEEGKLWYIDYPFAVGSGKITVATTRPETMLGDTAVAVNPRDKRYQKLVGRKLILPLVGRKIPLVADKMVDPEFGTGAVKITPAHDKDDFLLGKRHQLEVISVIGFDGKMSQAAGKKFAGLPIEKAREKVVTSLKNKGFLVKEEKYSHRVGHCERCKTRIEPLVSLQWFIKIKPLAKEAIKVVKEKKIKIIPPRFEKTYFHWLENIHDWCISRQLWWGHQLPIWYCGTKGLSNLQKTMNPDLLKGKKEEGCGATFVGERPPSKCPHCGKSCFVRDPDTFDTWFSSGQWPYSTLGYPNKRDYRYFYPTSVMETGYDILFFWVARMIMLGLYRTKKVPFRVVYLHGMVRDVFGQPMSKSRPETCIDPQATVEKYGADALRMALVYGTSAGNDMVVGEKKIEAMRNFTNKIWNAARFVMMISPEAPLSNFQFPRELKKEDRAILKAQEETVKTVNQQLEEYRFGQALETIYQFFWHQFCDRYLEAVKERRQEALPILLEVLIESLKLLHPFAPFITEEIYQLFRKKFSSKPDLLSPPALIIAPWPEGKKRKKK